MPITINRNLENLLFQYFASLQMYTKSLALNLGGWSGPSGGFGGPPGGFTGYLPQTRVAYDESEIASTGIPVSGASLLDNLNHIRYLIDETGTLVIQEDGTFVASGVTVVDFTNSDFEADDQGSGRVTIALASGVGAGALYLDDLIDVTTSGIQDYYGLIYDPGISLWRPWELYNVELVEDLANTWLVGLEDGDVFTYDDVNDWWVASGVVHYLDDLWDTQAAAPQDEQVLTWIAASGMWMPTTISGGIGVGGSGIAGIDIENDDTPVASDVTVLDFSDDFTVTDVGGDEVTIDLANPIPGSGVTIQQQIIFTIEGLIDNDVLGTQPLRLYSHYLEGGGTISEVMCAVNTAPTSSGIRVDVMKNGTSIFDVTEYVEIATSQFTATKNSDFDDTDIDKDDYYQIEVVQGDPVGSDLSVHVRFSWEAY